MIALVLINKAITRNNFAMRLEKARAFEHLRGVLYKARCLLNFVAL